MADIDPVVQPEDCHRNRNAYLWEEIGQSDVPQEIYIEGGIYTCSVEGNFSGSATIEFKYSKTSGGTPYSLDSTNLLFSAAGAWDIQIGRGYITPVLSSGDGSTDLDARLMPVPDHPA